MYTFLLALGAVIAATGIALLGSGISIQEHTFDPATVTPGVVAAIGGFIVIGLGLAVRVLQRIEQALAARPMPRADRPVETAPAVAPQPTNEPVRLPPPAKPKIELREVAPPAEVSAPAPPPAPATAADLTLEQFREKFPTVVRLDTGPVLVESNVSVLPSPPERLEQQTGEIAANGYVVAGANGTTPPPRAASPPEAALRPGKMPDRGKVSVFESFWPKGPRVGRQAQTAVAPVAMPTPAESEQIVEQQADVQPVPIPKQAPMPISILKSGVVDGMAYTLYSDGSIEAQLPQGTLRFGSITELRNHIERTS